MRDYPSNREEELKSLLADLPKKFTKLQLISIINWDVYGAGEALKMADEFLKKASTLLKEVETDLFENPFGTVFLVEGINMSKYNLQNDGGKPVPYGDARNMQNVKFRNN
ncbi:MAG TPA: hypothetical protein PLR18_04790 [bacterium]|nr:hypothetical protein [bacterium]